MTLRLRWTIAWALVGGAVFGALGESSPDLERKALGIREWTLDMSHLGASYRALRPAKARALKAAAIPAAWDSRAKGWVTPVKEQGAYGTCWAFSALASLESALLKTTGMAWDFSENHMACHDVGFAWGFDEGGNNQMATALLTSWRDPIWEVQDPYANPGSVVTAPGAFHVQNVIWLPERTVKGKTDEDDLLKRAVMDHGAVSVCYYHAESCYDSKLGSHYMEDFETFNYNPDTDGGHAVTLIGWDDDYPAANFVTPPPGNGAFLCKNSWGAADGTNGCIWISYHDDCFGFQTSAAFPRPEANDNYGRVYEYDSCGAVDAWGYGSGNESWGANVFAASAAGIVEAVGFYALAAGTEYKVRVYSGCSLTPNSGTLKSEQTGVAEYAGFVTVPLATPVPIAAAGERFAVVICLESSSNDYPLPVVSENYFYTGYCYELYCINVAAAGESFISGDGENWTDFQNIDIATGTENLCFKAYTRYEGELDLEYAPGWIDPQVTAGDSAATESNKVMAAMVNNGFSSDTASAVTRFADYSAFADWMSKHKITREQAVASLAPILSAALGADGLLELQPSDVRVSTFSPAHDGWKLDIALPDYDPLKVNPSLIKAALGVKGTPTLGEEMSADSLAVDVVPGADHIEAVVSPPDDATSYFFQTIVR